MSLGRRIFLFFASLKLAVITILTLSGVLAWGTIAESIYGTRGAKVLVYGTWWFGGVLFMLGLNVTCAALSRYPWKRTQTGFVVTHLGIIILLLGSVLTQRWGVDGNLPVTEKSASGEVILSDPVLTIREEDSGTTLVVPIPESHKLTEGTLLSTKLDDQHSLVLDSYMPRAQYAQVLRESPIPKVGYPAIRLEIYNDRFNLDERLLDKNPGAGTDLNLGPAIVNFRKLWTEAELKEFLSPKVTKAPAGKIGTLVVNFEGREFRMPIQKGYTTSRRMGKEQVSFRIDNYFSYAVVKNNELVNKSDENNNPAVQLTLQAGPNHYEKHTVFLNFPESPTKHRSKSKGEDFNVSFQLELNESMTSNVAIVGTNRGRLYIAQGPDDKLYYRVLSKEGAVNATGPAQVNETYQTGWMDLKFRIVEWHPYSVEVLEPTYVDNIQGTDGNFLAAARLKIVRNGRETAEEETGAAWILEGGRRSFSVDGKRYLVDFSKEELKLPFALHLEKFQIGHDPGTSKAASYASTVKVIDKVKGDSGPHVISMNEPLVYAGYTFYQASYQMQEGRAPISIFSVNWDPGRWVKYAGSLIMCLGIFIMFYMNPHYFDKIGFGFLRRRS